MTMTTAAAPVSACLARYSFRRNVLEKDRTYSLYPDQLVVEEEGVPIQAIDLARVRKVHLKYERTKQRAYFLCAISGGPQHLELKHIHFGGILRLEDRRETYTPFVRALLLAMAGRPGVQIKAGSMLNFITAIVGIPLTLGLGLVMLMLDQWAGMGAAALLLVMCLSVIRRSRPRAVDPANPPAAFLP